MRSNPIWNFYKETLWKGNPAGALFEIFQRCRLHTQLPNQCLKWVSAIRRKGNFDLTRFVIASDLQKVQNVKRSAFTKIKGKEEKTCGIKFSVSTFDFPSSISIISGWTFRLSETLQFIFPYFLQILYIFSSDTLSSCQVPAVYKRLWGLERPTLTVFVFFWVFPKVPWLRGNKIW